MPTKLNAILFSKFKLVEAGYIKLEGVGKMDFITFKSFISIPVLISFYYLGAFILPFFTWYFSTWIIRKFKFVDSLHTKGKEMIGSTSNEKQKSKLIAVFFVVFLFMELFWRMLFEFLIAYMQIRDALLQ